MSAGRLAKDIVATDFPLEDLAAPPVQAMFASFFFSECWEAVLSKAG